MPMPQLTKPQATMVADVDEPFEDDNAIKDTPAKENTSLVADALAATKPALPPEDVTAEVTEPPVTVLEPVEVAQPVQEPSLYEQLWEQLLADMPPPVKNALWEMGVTLETLLQYRPSQLPGLNPQQVQLIQSWLKVRGLGLQPEPRAVEKSLRDTAPSDSYNRMAARIAKFKKIRRA